MQYPNRIQSCLLLDDSFAGLDAVAHDVARVIQMKTGATFNTSEHNPGTFLRLFGGGEDLMLTFEYMPAPPEAQVFSGTLNSAITGILSPTMAQRVARAHSHILIEVSHGALGGVSDDPKIAAMFSELGVSKAWSTQEAFHRRLETLTLMTRVAIDHITPSAIHWTQSNQLLEPEKFEAMAGPASTMEFPNPLTIHPVLFGQREASGEGTKVGLRTLGARNWLGREILIPATTLPWAAAYQAAITFCRIATVENGYVIPDGDTFGHEGDETGDDGQLWRVHHREPRWTHHRSQTDSDSQNTEEGEKEDLSDTVPLYELVPLRHDACGFVSEDYASHARIIKSRDEAGESQPEFDTAQLPKEAAAILAEKRRMAEAIGGRFEVHTAIGADQSDPAQNASRGDDAPEKTASPFTPENPPTPTNTGPTNPAPTNPGEASVSGRGLRAKVFGRKGK